MAGCGDQLDGEVGAFEHAFSLDGVAGGVDQDDGVGAQSGGLRDGLGCGKGGIDLFRGREEARGQTDGAVRQCAEAAVSAWSAVQAGAAQDAEFLVEALCDFGRGAVGEGE